MSSRCSFLFSYFNDRFILIRDDWIDTVVEFLEQHVPGARRFNDPEFANLVFDQWLKSDISVTSYPVFGNHGIDGAITKQTLKGPIVCQVNSFIDVGSPFYAQFCSLKSGNEEKTDNTGFDTVFHQKTDDYDTKPSRLLKLALTDGESNLKAIEFWKCPELSLYCTPGSKILIFPQCIIRKGIFMLKPRNCQILGGGVGSLLSSGKPICNYANILGLQNQLKDLKVDMAPREEEKTPPPVGWQTPSGSNSVGNSNSNSSSIRRVPPGPSVNISRYFNKPACTPSTSKTHEKSPDLFNDDENEDDQSDFGMTPQNQISSMLRKIQDENDGDDDDDYRISRKIIRSPKKRKLTNETPQEKPNSVIRACGQLSSRRIDPMDEILENMIETGEEPASYPPKRKENPFKTNCAAKKIKVEAESDDDIQIIEISPVLKKKTVAAPEERKPPQSEESEEKLTEEERSALKVFSSLKLSSLSECSKKMKYSIGSKRFSILAIIEDIAEPLRVVDDLWTMKVQMTDESEAKREAYVDNGTLERLIGFTCQEAIAIRKSSDLDKRKDGKRRLESLEKQLQRLDLIFEIEFFPGATSSCPVVRSIKTLAEQLDVY